MSETETELQTTETLQLKKIDAGVQKVNELKELADKYKNLVVTEETLDEAEKARLDLYRARIDIQRDAKFNNEVLNKAKKINSSNEDTLIGLIEPTEKDIFEKVRQVKELVEKRKREAEQAEANRIKAIKAKIALIEKRISDIRLCASEQILDQIALEVSVQENSFSEFNEEGNSVVKMALTGIETRKLFLKEEVEAAKKRKELAEEAAKIKAEKEAKAENALVDVIVAEESVKEDIYHAHEIADTPDTPDNPDTPVTPKTVKEAYFKGFPMTTILSEIPVTGIKLSHYTFQYSGYSFTIPNTLKPEAKKLIEEAIREVIDEMPL